MLFIALDFSLNVYGNVVFSLGSVRASRSIHEKLVSSLLGSTFRCEYSKTPSRHILLKHYALDG